MSTISDSPKCKNLQLAQLPPSIHYLTQLHPSTPTILLPQTLQKQLSELRPLHRNSSTYISVNDRLTRILPRTLPNPPLALISPHNPCVSITLTTPVINNLTSITVSQILPPVANPALAGSIQRLVRNCLRFRDACVGDILPVAQGLWYVITNTQIDHVTDGTDAAVGVNVGVVTDSTDVIIDLSTSHNPGLITPALAEWVLHAWHAPSRWTYPYRMRLIEMTESGRRHGVFGVTGTLPDVYTLTRQFSIGRYVQILREGDEKSVMEVLASAELHNGVVVIPAGPVETLAMRVVTRSREGDYLRFPPRVQACIIVVGRELFAAAGEVSALMEIPAAQVEEREAILKGTRDIGASDLNALIGFSNGFAREHVEGIGRVFLEGGIEACKEAVRFFGSTVSVDTGGVGWGDVGGLDFAKGEILDLVHMNDKNSDDEDFVKGVMNRRVGVLLYGPPGTGKTLLARAVASEAGCSFISVKGPELFDMYVGESEKNVREVFRRAIDAAPCIVFFDEIDALAPNRGRGSDSGGVSDRVVSQLLAELDEVAVIDDVFVIAASNRPDLVDPGLLRPGRLDKVVYIPMPGDRKEQAKILGAQTRKFLWDDDVDLVEALEHAPVAPFLSGADLYGLASRAWMNAAKRTVEEEGVDGTDDRADEIRAGREIRDAQEWACNIDRIYGDWFREEKVYEREYSVVPLLKRERLNVKSTVRVSQEDLITAAEELTPSLSEKQLREYEELRKRMEGW